MIRMTGGVILSFLAVACSAMAQDEPPKPVPIILHPARAPVPALRYRLLPERNMLQPGNAAIFYHRGIQLMLEGRATGAGNGQRDRKDPTDEELLVDWVTGPLTAIPLDRARRYLDTGRNRGAIREAELGAQRLACDWQFDTRPEGFDLLIPEIQEMRTLVRLVALKARLALLDKRPEEALHWLQTGYAMARHISQGPLVIQMLVGVASGVMLTRPMEDLIQTPGMASLYWALVDRPHPFIDPRIALEGERSLLERELPQLRELDGLPWSIARAREFTDVLQTKLYTLTEWARPGRNAWGTEETRGWLNRLGVAALVAHAYPEAKRALIARGRSRAEVEAMPTIQVAFLDAYLAYQVYRDDIYKWTGLPYHRLYEAIKREPSPDERIQGRPLVKFLCSLMPGTRAALTAAARLERQLDALECVEAIRIYAADHGRLPASLDAMAETPVPLDPMTGRPFEYRTDGDRAFLTAPTPAGLPPRLGNAIRYELKLTR